MSQIAPHSSSSVKLGKYRVIAELGHGGMAVVYLGLSEGASGFKKLVVIKSLREHLANSPEFCQMLLDEARLAARLNHPNVVQTNEVGTYGGRPALVMEYLEGQPLSAILSRSRSAEPIPLSMHLKIISEALIGLEYAHELTDFDGTSLNLVHRDISPSNVFVTFDGNVKVLDFGIAKAATSSHNTNTGELKGKIAYMSPEQMLGERIIDRRADLFSMGVMIWEAAAGCRIWEGCNEVTIMRRVLNDEMPTLREARPDVPESLVRICEKALAVDRSNRYATAAEIERDLDAVLAELAETVKLKDIGRYVGTMFADVRSKTRKVIEDQAKFVEAGDASLEPVALAELLDRSSSAKAAPPTLLSRRPSGIARRAALWAPALFLGVAVAGFVVATKHGPPAGTPPSTAATAGTALEGAGRAKAGSPTEQPATVEIALNGSPESARLFWDGDPLPGNPANKTLPKDGSQHTLRAEAPGFVAREVPVTLDRSTTITLNLERSPPSASAPARYVPARAAAHPAQAVPPPQPAPTPPPQPSSPPPKTQTNCDPPFYVDDQGIRHPKPSCM